MGPKRRKTKSVSESAASDLDQVQQTRGRRSTAAIKSYKEESEEEEQQVSDDSGDVVSEAETTPEIKINTSILQEEHNEDEIIPREGLKTKKAQVAKRGGRGRGRSRGSKTSKVAIVPDNDTLVPDEEDMDTTSHADNEDLSTNEGESTTSKKRRISSIQEDGEEDDNNKEDTSNVQPVTKTRKLQVTRGGRGGRGRGRNNKLFAATEPDTATTITEDHQGNMEDSTTSKPTPVKKRGRLVRQKKQKEDNIAAATSTEDTDDKDGAASTQVITEEITSSAKTVSEDYQPSSPVPAELSVINEENTEDMSTELDNSVSQSLKQDINKEAINEQDVTQDNINTQQDSNTDVIDEEPLKTIVDDTQLDATTLPQQDEHQDNGDEITSSNDNDDKVDGGDNEVGDSKEFGSEDDDDNKVEDDDEDDDDEMDKMLVDIYQDYNSGEEEESSFDDHNKSESINDDLHQTNVEDDTACDDGDHAEETSAAIQDDDKSNNSSDSDAQLSQYCDNKVSNVDSMETNLPNPHKIDKISDVESADLTTLKTESNEAKSVNDDAMDTQSSNNKDFDTKSLNIEDMNTESSKIKSTNIDTSDNQTTEEKDDAVKKLDKPNIKEAEPEVPSSVKTKELKSKSKVQKKPTSPLKKNDKLIKQSTSPLNENNKNSKTDKVLTTKVTTKKKIDLPNKVDKKLQDKTDRESDLNEDAGDDVLELMVDDLELDFEPSDEEDKVSTPKSVKKLKSTTVKQEKKVVEMNLDPSQNKGDEIEVTQNSPKDKTKSKDTKIVQNIINNLKVHSSHKKCYKAYFEVYDVEDCYMVIKSNNKRYDSLTSVSVKAFETLISVKPPTELLIDILPRELSTKGSSALFINLFTLFSKWHCYNENSYESKIKFWSSNKQMRFSNLPDQSEIFYANFKKPLQIHQYEVRFMYKCCKSKQKLQAPSKFFEPESVPKLISSFISYFTYIHKLKRFMPILKVDTEDINLTIKTDPNVLNSKLMCLKKFSLKVKRGFYFEINEFMLFMLKLDVWKKSAVGKSNYAVDIKYKDRYVPIMTNGQPSKYQANLSTGEFELLFTMLDESECTPDYQTIPPTTTTTTPPTPTITNINEDAEHLKQLVELNKDIVNLMELYPPKSQVLKCPYILQKEVKLKEKIDKECPNIPYYIFSCIKSSRNIEKVCQKSG